MLLAAVKQYKCEVVDLGITHDTEAAVVHLLDNALASHADVLITSGGVSVGDKDFVKPLLEQRGTVYFTKVNPCCITRSILLWTYFCIQHILNPN